MRCSTFPAAARSACFSGRSRDPGDALRDRCAVRPAARLFVLRLPADRGGRVAKGERIIVKNRVLFHRLATTLNYLDIRTVIVSCGTCLDQLEGYDFGSIFPGARLLDIHEYLLEKGVKLKDVNGMKYMYHDPCHTPIKTAKPLAVVGALMGAECRSPRGAVANREPWPSRGPMCRRRCASPRRSRCARASRRSRRRAMR